MRHLLSPLHERKNFFWHDPGNNLWHKFSDMRGASKPLYCFFLSPFQDSFTGWISDKSFKWGLRHKMVLKQNSLHLWTEQKSPKPTEKKAIFQTVLAGKKKLLSKLNWLYKIKLNREGIFVPGTLKYNCRDMMWVAILCKTWVLIMMGTTIYNQFHHPYHHLHLHHLH